jgi:hypothetical protein
MTIRFYVKTKDEPKVVGDLICSFSFVQGLHPEDKYSWIMQKGKGDYWEIRGKYAPLKDLSVVGIVYRAGDSIVLSEIDDSLASVFTDPLIEKYGFDKVKWLVIPFIR